MADTAKRLAGPTQLTTSAVTQYTVPAATTCSVINITVTNGTSTTRTVTVSIGTDAAGTRFLDAFNVPPNDAVQWKGPAFLVAAEIIQAKASAASALTILINGVETA